MIKHLELQAVQKSKLFGATPLAVAIGAAGTTNPTGASTQFDVPQLLVQQGAARPTPLPPQPTPVASPHVPPPVGHAVRPPAIITLFR